VIRLTWRFEGDSDGCRAATIIAMALLNFAIWLKCIVVRRKSLGRRSNNNNSHVITELEFLFLVVVR
jgi:hypothetical protein